MKLVPNWIRNLLPKAQPEAARTWMSARQAGVYVSPDTALTYAAVWACVRIIAESLSAMPFHVYESTPTGKRRKADHLVERIMHRAPNDDMTAFTWRELAFSHALLWGNHYSEIERDMMGRPLRVHPIAPNAIAPKRDASGTLYYEVNLGNGAQRLEARDVLHLHGLGFDGLVGYSPVAMAARSIGVGLAQDQFAGAYFGNGTVLGGVIEQKEGRSLSPEAREALLKSFRDAHQGAANAFKVQYLDAGMEFKALDMPMTDAQFLESRRFQVQEIARWFRVPPHKLADLERATFSNIEHQALEFVTDTLMPWAVRLEQEINLKLFGQVERGRVYGKIELGGLLRGDIQSRYNAYAVGRQWGWLSANDIRALEDMDRIAGGDDYLAPVNMVPADRLRAESEARTAPPPEPEPAPESDNNEEQDDDDGRAQRAA